MFKTFCASTLTSAFVLALSLGAVQAADRYVTFGDSLSDPGNIFAITGSPPAPYYQGRYSNGLTWIEQLSGTQQTFTTFGGGGSGNVDFAFGGARTDANVFSSGTSIPYGLQSQIQAYLARGGAFSATDIVSVWAGANNLFNAFDTTYPGYTTPTPTSVAAVMTSAAADIKTALSTLVANGARKLVVLNLPDLGLTPAFYGGAGQAAASFATATFNTQLAANLAALKAANPNLNIIQIDVKAVFDLVSSNPAMFGFSNATSSCVTTTSCVTANKAGQNQYAFWDTVHPTEAGHALIAAVAAQYLNWESSGAGLARLGDAALAQHAEAVGRSLSRFDEIARGEKAAESAYVEMIVGSSTGSAFDGNAGFRQSAIGLAVGAHHAFSPALSVVVEGSFLGGGFRAGLYESDTIGGNANVALSWTSGDVFLRGGAGASFGYFSSLSRKTVAALSNSSDQFGVGGGAVLEAGYRWKVGALDISPRARFGWMGMNFGEATESGIVAPLAIQAHTVSTLVGGAEVQASYEILREEVRRVSVTGSLGYERWFGMSDYRPEATLANNTAATAVLGGASPTGPGWIVGVGLGGRLTPTVLAGVNYRASIGEHAMRQEGRASLQVKF